MQSVRTQTDTDQTPTLPWQWSVSSGCSPLSQSLGPLAALPAGSQTESQQERKHYSGNMSCARLPALTKTAREVGLISTQTGLRSVAFILLTP